MKKLLIICLYVFLHFFTVLGQSQNQLEEERQKLQEQIWQLSLAESALNKQLHPLQIKIDSLQKSPKSSKNLNALQKEALKISQQLVRLQNRLDSLNNHLTSINNRLFQLYSQQIDSLRQSLKNNASKKQKHQLLQKIKTLTQRRLLVSPELQSLNMDLQNIRHLNLTQVKDSLKRQILIDYLQNILQQIETQQQTLELKRKELQQMKRLRQKALSFVTEIDDAQLTSPLPFSQTRTTSTSPQSETQGPTDGAFYTRSPNTTPASEIVVDLPQIDQLIAQSLQNHASVPIDSVLKAIQRAQSILGTYQQLVKSKLPLQTQ